MESAQGLRAAPACLSYPRPRLTWLTRRTPWLPARYGFAVLAAAVALLVRHGLTRTTGPGLPAYVTFYPAVMFTGTLCGFGPGLLATAVSALLAAYWILPPVGRLAIHSPTDAAGLAIFVAMGVGISLVAELYHRARDRAAAALATQREQARALRERTRMEEALQQALADKETLLKEVHHRTKNNLQMLCSLLELQAQAIESPEGKEALELSTGRIYAIARLYEQLYRSMSSGQVILCEYLRGLAENFQNTYATHGITVQLPPLNGIYLDVDRAIPCGLIVNELLTNAVKHAFPPEVRGTVGIGLRKVGAMVELRVWDNGRGLPADLDIATSTSLGLRLVRILALRLRADITVESYEGAAFTLTFPAHGDQPLDPVCA